MKYAPLYGITAACLFVFMTVGFYQAVRLWTNAPVNVLSLKFGSAVTAVLCFTVFILSYLAIRPEAAVPGHSMLFEAEEWAALLFLPFVTAAAYLIYSFGERLHSSPAARESVAALLSIAYFYFMVAFGLGVVLRLKPVL